MRKSRDVEPGEPSWVPDFSSPSILSAHHLSQDGCYTDRPVCSSGGTRLHLFGVELGRCLRNSKEQLYCAFAKDVQMAKHRWRHDAAEGVDVYPDQHGVSARVDDLVMVPQGLESYNRALILRKAEQMGSTGEEFQVVGTCRLSDRTAGMEERGLESNVRGIGDEVEERQFIII